MRFLFSHRLWFAPARLPFRRRPIPLPEAPALPICGQAALTQLPAGQCTMDYMGCEMIALCNGLQFTGCPRPLTHIIQTFERRRWLMLGGRWGADPYAIGRYLREEGLPFAEFPGKKQFFAFENAVNLPENRVFLLSFWLGDTVFSGAHAVALVRRDGKLWGYNLFNRQTEPLSVIDLSCLLPPHRFIVGYVLGGTIHEA